VRLQKRIRIGRQRRCFRVRNQVRRSTTRPRLHVFRSNKHIYCQVIDDALGRTVASASTRDRSLRDQVPKGGNCGAARVIGQAIAQRALAAGVKSVALDRGSFRFHGRLADLAKAAREGGLEF
jgi:large subunit ribosomal protein L18